MVVGCGKVSEESELLKTGREIEERGGDATEKSETETSMVEEELELVEKFDSGKIPQYVQKIYQCYKELQETYDLQYAAVEGKGPKMDEESSKCFFELINMDNPGNTMRFRFKSGLVSEIMEKSYRIFFEPADDQYLKDVITATFMITGGLEYAEAKEKTQEFTNSYVYEKGKVSIPFHSGEYTLYYSSGGRYVGSEGSGLVVVYKEEAFEDINKEEYAPADHSKYLYWEKNELAKMKLIGKVVEIRRKEGNTGDHYLTVADVDGKKYQVFLVSLYSNAIEFELGKQYVFYGFICSFNGDVYIEIQAFEPYES